MSGRYRFRTSMRMRLPLALGFLAPKGRRDCGNHDWYLARSEPFSEWRCYHCEAGVTHTVPWGERELAARRLEAEAIRRVYR